MAASVIVIGGGVAGLTAAHELIERGFKVDVYESRPTWGGKARSQPVPGSATGTRKELPGEHGFRFYPRFYKHVIDTMHRIPTGTGTVEDRLKPTTESAIALVDDDTWFRFFRKKVTRPYDILEALELFFNELDFDQGDVTLFAAKILQFFTTCDERRLGEYERMSWWEFLDADKFSPKFQRQLRAVPRTMVAMDPKNGSAFTVGTISMQLILDYADSGVNNDRTMGGPTSEMWFDPWFEHLIAKGVGLHAGKTVVELQTSPTQISGVKLDDGTVATADFYVLAVPIDKVVTMITPQMAAMDPVLANLGAKNPDDLVSWMVGIQYFLYEDVPLVRGHTFYPDSPWALTSISQPQFWRDLGLFRKRYGDGQVGGLISVDISDWNTPGTFIPKIAKECTPDEIKHEVWQQLKAALNGTQPEDKVLTDELLHSAHLDDDLDFSGPVTVNNSRLLIHPPGSWDLRPEPGTAIPNLVLAGDYIKTHTNLASMEGANEAARKAVNVILQRSGSTAGPCQTWPLTEPARFDAWKALDAQLYAHGKGHLFELMGIKRAAEAADLLRRFTAFTGLSKVDDLLDKVRATSIIKGILTRLGVPLAPDEAR